jgi:hypothetical protein
MSTRIFERSGAILSLLALAACGSSGDAGNVAATADSRVVCALAGSDDFSRVCSLERKMGERGMELTVGNPGGGFHRLLVTRDGKGVVAADGAEAATVSIAGEHEIQVAISGDRYVLPATIKAH